MEVALDLDDVRDCVGYVHELRQRARILLLLLLCQTQFVDVIPGGAASSSSSGRSWLLRCPLVLGDPVVILVLALVHAKVQGDHTIFYLKRLKLDFY